LISPAAALVAPVRREITGQRKSAPCRFLMRPRRYGEIMTVRPWQLVVRDYRASGANGSLLEAALERLRARTTPYWPGAGTASSKRRHVYTYIRARSNWSRPPQRGR
jgi:hypothetical protein